MARNTRMLGAQVYIPNGRDEEEEPRRSPISAFGADGEGNFTFYGDEDARLRAGYDGIVANAAAQRLDRARRGRATLGSIVGHAMRNGGMVPRELAQSVGMELGQPGFVGGTLAQDGTFMSLGRGRDGSIQPTGIVAAPDVLRAMVRSGNWRDASAFNRKFVKGRLTDQQIESATGFSQQWVNDAQAKEDANNRKIVLQGLFDIAKQQKDRQPMTAREAWQRGMSDPKFIEAWLTKPDPDSADGGRIPLNTDEEIANAMKRFESAYGEVASGGGNGAANPFQERVLALADKVFAPAPVDPNVAEMRQRATRRANVIDAAGGPSGQRAVYDYLPDGRVRERAAYVVDGRVYDTNGDEMQGEFYDGQGNLIQPAAQAPQGQVSQADAAAELARRKAARAGQAQGGGAADDDDEFAAYRR